MRNSAQKEGGEGQIRMVKHDTFLLELPECWQHHSNSRDHMTFTHTLARLYLANLGPCPCPSFRHWARLGLARLRMGTENKVCLDQGEASSTI